MYLSATLQVLFEFVEELMYGHSFAKNRSRSSADWNPRSAAAYVSPFWRPWPESLHVTAQAPGAGGRENSLGEIKAVDRTPYVRRSSGSPGHLDQRDDHAAQVSRWIPRHAGRGRRSIGSSRAPRISAKCLHQPTDPNRPAPPKGGDGLTGADNVGGYNNFWLDSRRHPRRGRQRRVGEALLIVDSG